MQLKGCQSVKLVTVDKYVVPPITFPIFPLAEQIIPNEDGTSTVPSDWIINLAEYQLLIEETENNYKELKELYEGDSNK